MAGLRGLRPELTRRLAALDAFEAKLRPDTMNVSEKLEVDLYRSVLKAYLGWLNRAEKTLEREARALETSN